MADLPAMVKVAGQRCVVVGGGKTALRRARSLLECGARLSVVSPGLVSGFDQLRAAEIHQRTYQSGDVVEARIVVAATDDPAVNAQVARDARLAGAMVNRVDEPGDSDLLIPAHGRRGPITLAVHTGGISAKAAARLRDQLLDQLDPAWITLLEIAGPYRSRIKRHEPDAQRRQALLVQLTDETALELLKTEGEPALQAHLERLVSDQV